ncbi:MAG: preprotein translocase subunit SecG [Deltaproteobacteria bacterium]|nr:preprotein translocase subunit SecG [Deltaproteobacteria bacterium]
MIIFVTVIHIIVSIGLILIVLLQTGKGADMGAVFGGSSSTIFGSSGAGNFLTRLTTGFAVVFMITSLTLGYFSGKRSSSSVFDRGGQQAEQPARQQPIPVPQSPASQGQKPPQAPPDQAPQTQKPATP